jgi:glycosyltransferase involved in cell wall biosynthesis
MVVTVAAYRAADLGKAPSRCVMYLPNGYTGVGVPYTAASIGLGLELAGMPTRFYLNRCWRKLPAGLPFRSGLPAWLPGRFQNIMLQDMAHARNERHAIEALGGYGVPPLFWTWPEPSAALLDHAKRRQSVIVREMINTHVATAKRVLDAEFERLGLPADHNITQEAIDRETESLAQSDVIVAPSAAVAASLVEHGCPEDKILHSSFGWDPGRIAGSGKLLPPVQGVTALFVGRIGIRKGIPLLLDAWAKSGVTGRLVLAGSIEDAVRPILAQYADRADIIFPGFIKDVGGLYRSCDFMLFPTLEEGAPLVTYEAAGTGLPVITTEMGAARIIQDGVNGRILAPGDLDAWIDAIQQMAQNVEARRAMSDAARAGAANYSWNVVAAQRLSALEGRGLISLPVRQ